MSWNIQNHIKIFQLPIGLDYHTIYNNANNTCKKEYELTSPYDQELILK